VFNKIGSVGEAGSNERRKEETQEPACAKKSEKNVFFTSQFGWRNEGNEEKKKKNDDGDDAIGEVGVLNGRKNGKIKGKKDFADELRESGEVGKNTLSNGGKGVVDGILGKGDFTEKKPG